MVLKVSWINGAYQEYQMTQDELDDFLLQGDFLRFTQFDGKKLINVVIPLTGVKLYSKELI